ncbi:MAG: MFS transporter [Caldilineaceae bacterium]|nr:MFS transporter [Caldilineaceae bacterium]
MASSSASLRNYGTLVRTNRNFRYIWFGEIVSLLGDWFNLIASATLVGLLTNSGVALGGLFVVRMLAPFLVSTFGGPLIDRYNRKHILIVTDVLRGVVVLGFLFIREPSHVPWIYLLTALQLGLSGIFFPARNALFPDIVARHELGTANALSSSTWSTMLAIGTALGGFVAGGLGINVAFMLDSLTFFLSALFIAAIAYQPNEAELPPTAPARTRPTNGAVAAILNGYREGFAYLREQPHIFFLILQKSFVMFCFATAYDVTAVAISQNVFVIGQGGGIGLGLIYATVGIGTGVGPILMRMWTGDDEQKLRFAIMISYCISAFGMFLAAPMVTTGYSFTIFLIGLIIRGFGGGTVWVFASQLGLQTIADRVRGRVFATEFALFSLMASLAAASAGWALERPAVGYGGVVWTLPVLTMIPALLWAIALRRAQRQRVEVQVP